MDYPIVRSLWMYYPVSARWLSVVAMALFPISIPVYMVGLRQLRILRDELHKIVKVSDELNLLIEKEHDNE